jgi:hypothetical protein
VEMMDTGFLGVYTPNSQSVRSVYFVRWFLAKYSGGHIFLCRPVCVFLYFVFFVLYLCVCVSANVS